MASNAELLIAIMIDPGRPIKERTDAFDKLLKLPCFDKIDIPLIVWIYEKVWHSIRGAGADVINDVVEEVLLGVWEGIYHNKIHGFKKIASREDTQENELLKIFINYVNWMIRRELTNFFRNQAKIKPVDLDKLVGKEAEFGLISNPSTTDEECEDALAKLRKADASVNDIKIFELHMEGYENEEIAEMLSKKGTAVKQSIFRSRKKIRESRER